LTPGIARRGLEHQLPLPQGPRKQPEVGSQLGW
jgi:hypothetical protein